MLAISRYLQDTATSSALRPFKITKGSQVSNARTETNSKVFVNRLFCEALFSCCEATLSL